MKKLIFLLIAAMLLTSLISCGKTDNNDASDIEDKYLELSSGGKMINPKRCLLYSHEYDGELLTMSDGFGFFAQDVELEKIPSLTLDGDITLNVPDKNYSTLYNSFEILNNDYMSIGRVEDISELASLPTGEYVILFREKTDTRCGDESIDTYKISENDCVFRLIV